MLAMSETQSNPSAETSLATGSPEPSRGDLSRLHHMSTTAGLTGNDYVAVNPLAVASVLLGLGSALSLLSEIFLILTVAGVIVGIAALRQIAGSNGTQTGRGLAWGGMFLCLLLAGTVGTRQVMAAQRLTRDKQQIDDLMGKLNAAIQSHNYDAAYALFSKGFRERTLPKDFVERWKFIESLPNYGGIKQLTWNRLLEVMTDDTGRVRRAITMMQVHFNSVSTDSAQTMQLVDEGGTGQWRIDDLPFLNPPPGP